MSNLNKILCEIQTTLKAHKGQRNSFGKYNYRSAEDVLEALKPHLTKHNVTIQLMEEVIDMGGELFIKSFATLSDGESGITATAYAGIDLNAKGMSKAQATGASSSYAKKYALGNLFLLDDTKDADATNTHGKGNSTPTAKKKLTKDIIAKMKDAVASGNKEQVSSALANYEVSASQRKEILG